MTWIILAFLVLMPNESSSTTGLSLKEITPIGYLATQQGVIVHYLKLIIWPSELCLDYAWAPAVRLIDIIFPAITVLSFLLLTIFLVWKKKPIGFCLAWFFIILAPTSSIMPIADYAVEHRLYLSPAGITVLFSCSIFLFVNILLSDEPLAKLSAILFGFMRHIPFFCNFIDPTGIRNCSKGKIFSPKMQKKFLHSSFTRGSKFRVKINDIVISSVFLIFIVIALMVRTIDRNNDYSSSLTIIQKIIDVNPYNLRMRVLLIDSFMDEYMFSKAEQEARATLAVIEDAMKRNKIGRYSLAASNPDNYYSVVNNQIGSALLCQNKNEEAIEFFMRSVTIDPRFVIGQYNLAVALRGINNDNDALREVLKAIDIDPKYGRSYTLAGILMMNFSRYEEAISYFEESLKLDDSSISAKVELAWLLATVDPDKGRDGKRAVALARNVCEISGGGNYRTLDILAAAYAADGDFVSAIKTAKEALSLAELVEKKKPGVFDSKNEHISSSPNNIRKRIALYQNRKTW